GGQHRNYRSMPELRRIPPCRSPELRLQPPPSAVPVTGAPSWTTAAGGR
ncbi:hypothetical protein A2U01_0099246, partial [Trifolium medium]|nr:hypothetical protein [Trifolium medium]